MISVIVPVYNVEPYLPECLDSILGQTCRALEIILIDDGSTDGSSQICEAYRERDARIRVFREENRGVSAARNLGLDNASGEWIMFVDADDYVSPDYCALPLQTALEQGADLVTFEAKRVGWPTERKDKARPTGVLTCHEAVEFGRPAPWDKLYRRELFREIRYPEGRLGEDIATIYRVICAANRIVWIDSTLYHYRYRENSVSKVTNERAANELYIAHLERYQYLLEQGYPRERAERVIFTKSLDYLERTAPADTPLYRRAEELVTTLSVDPDKLSAHARDCLKLWNMSHALLNTVYRLRHAKGKEAQE